MSTYGMKSCLIQKSRGFQHRVHWMNGMLEMYTDGAVCYKKPQQGLRKNLLVCRPERVRDITQTAYILRNTLLLFYKDMFHENIEAENCEILGIF